MLALSKSDAANKARTGRSLKRNGGTVKKSVAVKMKTETDPHDPLAILLRGTYAHRVCELQHATVMR